MEPVCYRCHAAVERDANYCLNCGAPQIRFVAGENAPPETGAADTSAHTLPAASEHGGLVRWKPAIQAALSTAIAAGILSTLMAIGSILWVGAGSMLAIRIYRRHEPHAHLPKRVGARIGAVVGAFAAAVALIGNAALMAVQRFGTHRGVLIDQQMTDVIHQAAKRAAAMDPQAPVHTFVNFWLSAEGRVGLVLLAMGFLCVLILLFAIAGGMLGAQMYGSSNGRNAIP